MEVELVEKSEAYSADVFRNVVGCLLYTSLSEVRSLIENEKVESVVINGSSLKMVMKSVNGQPQEVITKEIPLESIGDYEKYLAESADKGLILSLIHI